MQSRGFVSKPHPRVSARPYCYVFVEAIRARARPHARAALVLLAVLASACTGVDRPLVTLHAERGAVQVQVELALTPEELSRGLMWREELAGDAGMLFVFPDQAIRSFWMKNTPLALDIIYIDRNGRVVSIAQHTVPYSTAPIPSRKPAKYVLEVAAGFARRHGVRAGQRVELPRLPEP